jgi:Ran GTPase-activating protein (RanGAP) involved in mRNA processing and transport
MQHKLEKLMRKKAEKGDVLSKSHAKAKSGILKDLMDDMMGMEGEKVKGLKKVTVASNSPMGLKKGLEKAEDIVEEMPNGEEMPEGEEMSEEESSEEESPEMEVAEEEGEENVEDLKAEIEKLKEKLAKHNLA